MSNLPRYVTDTHPLVWHLRRSRRLSTQARALFQQADQGQAQIVIPAMVLVEVMYLAEHNRITAHFVDVIQLVHSSTNYLIQPLDETIVAAAQQVPNQIELHDRLIAATAIVLHLPLITKDEALRKATVLQTIW